MWWWYVCPRTTKHTEHMETPATITKQERDRIANACERLNAWMSINKCYSYKQEELPADLLPTPTNEERAQVELFDFIHDPPTKYFTYQAGTGAAYHGTKTLQSGDKLTIWTGLPLGHIVGTGSPYHGNMGDVRQSFTAQCVNGRKYHGTAYISAGDYVRMTAAKRN